jgi:hypothetical protein
MQEILRSGLTHRTCLAYVTLRLVRTLAHYRAEQGIQSFDQCGELKICSLVGLAAYALRTECRIFTTIIRRQERVGFVRDIVGDRRSVV